jgi:uncharacterized protein YfdQ (DUF2303 family)
MHNDTENIAQTLAKELPKPIVLLEQSSVTEDKAILHLALPNNFKHIQVDTESLLDHPRRTKAAASLTEPAAFLEYVARHRGPTTVVWADFNPVTFKLSFKAVIDEHGPNDVAGWRQHSASFTPVLSNEWGIWTGNNGSKNAMDQFSFAMFLENQEDDIAVVEGFPTNLDMMKMATEFEARQDQAIKSTVRIQNGGVELSYVSNDDAQTIEKMKVFDKFKIGIPVFRGMKDEMGKALGYLIEARLRYRTAQGKATFWYELVRPDKTHEAAADQLIRTIKEGLGDVPMLMGSSS